MRHEYPVRTTYLQPQGRGLGGLRRGKRREGRRAAATQRDRRAVFIRTVGAALGQRSADEIGDAVEQDVRTGHHALAGPSAGQKRQSLFGVAVQNTEILPAMAAGWFCPFGRRTSLGEGFHALVQQRAPA